MFLSYAFTTQPLLMEHFRVGMSNDSWHSDAGNRPNRALGLTLTLTLTLALALD